jgi:hypothetical protein
MEPPPDRPGPAPVPGSGGHHRGIRVDYTILRPAWLTDADEVSYEVTQRNEPFKGTEVSRKSVAALVTDIVTHPGRWARANLGVDKPGTDGDKPAFA